MDLLLFLSSSIISPCGSVRTIDSFSDHAAIQCILPLSTPETPVLTRKTLLHNRAPVDSINSNICLNLKRQIIPIRSNLLNGDLEQLTVNFGTILLLNKQALAIQRGLKKRQRKLFRLGRGFLLPSRAANNLKNEMKLLKKMLIDAINTETNKFLADAYGSIESNEDAFRIIKRFTGHKKRSPPPIVLFKDDCKTNMLTGTESIANSLANLCLANNELTTNFPSSHANDVYASANILANQLCL